MSEQACGAPAEVLERIKKLLRLAGNNPSQAEAELAAAKAQELMDRWKIESASVDTGEGGPKGEPVSQDHEAIDLTKRFSSWRSRLLSEIAGCNACIQVLGRGMYGNTAYRLYGTRTNVEYCRWLYQWVVPQVERLAREHAGAGKTWINNFKLGVVAGVGHRLRAQREASKQAAAGVVTSTALAVFDRESKAVAEFYKDNSKGFKMHNAGRSRGDYGARQAGLSAAERVGLNRPLNGTSQRRIDG